MWDAGAAGRLYALLEQRPKLLPGTVVPPTDAIKGQVFFKDITFAYPTRPDNTVLKGKKTEPLQGSVSAEALQQVADRTYPNRN